MRKPITLEASRAACRTSLRLSLKSFLATDSLVCPRRRHEAGAANVGALEDTDGVQADNFNVDPAMLLTSVFGVPRIRSGSTRKGE
ncbi:hypothetical protein PCAR4_60264 [Paraburkholderia caribensis]|nr:hypothetical protein PCAR4_60264 [Paraburkholderia caribensis]